MASRTEAAVAGRSSASHHLIAVLSPHFISNIPRCNLEFRQSQPKGSTAKKDPSHKPRPDWNLCWKALTPEEKRIELVKAPTIEDQRKYIEDADLIIWACGYQSNPIKVKDNDGKLINLQAK